MVKEIIVHILGISFNGALILSNDLERARKNICEELKKFLETHQQGYRADIKILFVNSSWGDEHGNEGKDLHIEFKRGDDLAHTLFREESMQKIFKDALKGWCHRGIVRFFVSKMADVTSKIEVSDAVKN